MIKYIVSIEYMGEQKPVGVISGESSIDAQFHYFPQYIHDASASPVSINLPLQAEPFSPEQTKCFFEGLLPEGFTRRSVAQWMHLDEGDYLSLLYHLGKECLGALRVSWEDDAEEESFYEPLDMKQVQALAAEGASKSTEFVAKAHLSLTGASGKVGLYYDPMTNHWYLPHGTAPSTHIVKQSHVRLGSIVANEQLCQMTASKCGLTVPHSFIIDTGGGQDRDVLFATQRYDRIFRDVSQTKHASGLPVPFRLHQEDFAQAMGIPASRKYEQEGQYYLRDMFSLLRTHAADPVQDQLKLWDQLVFHYLIGNTDAHLKNYSVIYSTDMRRLRLAPAYDLVSTVIYDGSTREMSMHLGNARQIDDVTEESFKQAAKEAGLGERMALRRLHSLREQFRPALEESAQELLDNGFQAAEDIKNKILEWYSRT